MTTYCVENLKELKSLIASLHADQYVHKSPLMSQSSIGQHIRHILEFYICLIKGYKSGIVNYDKRERNHIIENDRSFAMATIDEIDYHLSHITEDAKLELEANFGNNNHFFKISSSVHRELAYCLEHSIHHEALIKIGLIEQQCGKLVSKDFGVAPATINYREQLTK